jgi:glutamate N-acetyltransferase/amino-acid N-acetyltransferase
MDKKIKINTPKGFWVAGVHCGLKADQEKDLALIVSDTPCQVMGAFTTNKVKAAPVLYDQAILNSGKSVRAIIVNAGNANACTGDQGIVHTKEMARQTASIFGGLADDVLVLSTGVIGVQLPMKKIISGIGAAGNLLIPDGWEDAAQAIMTTDTQPKVYSIRSAEGYTITGIAKGSGMIAPNMATMLAVIATDVILSPEMKEKAAQIWEQSFNRIVVDGDMSTNDTVLLIANGAAGITPTENFEKDLLQVCSTLAKAVVQDGEGATKLVKVIIRGAAKQADAKKIARAIATSSLCKTAFYGADPNWGRFICAAGYAGVDIEVDKLILWIKDKNEKIKLFENAQAANYDEAAGISLMNENEWAIELDLCAGSENYWLWTCDLSHEYITINGHYRT